MLLALLHRWSGAPRRRTPVRSASRRSWTLQRLEERATPTVAYAVGAGAGGGPQVNVYNTLGQQIAIFNAYNPAFTGGVQVALTDLNNDGNPDIITAPGFGGGPHIRVFDGAGLEAGIERPLMEFNAYDPAFIGGVYVAGGDVDNDGVGDIITGPGAGGGPHVKVFSGATGNEILSFNGYDPAFTGGVRVGSGDFGGDNDNVAGSRAGDVEIVMGPGPGGGPHVRVWDYDAQLNDPDNFGNFLAFDPSYTGGLFVYGGFLTNNRDADNFIYSDIVVGQGQGGEVRTFRLDGFIDAAQRDVAQYLPANQVIAGDPATVDPGYQGASFFPYPGFLGGVRIGTVTDLNGDGRDEFITGAGPGGGPHVRVLNGATLAEIDGFFAFGNFGGGVFVG